MKPDAEIDPPLVLKVLGALLGSAFFWAATRLAGQSWIAVPMLVAIGTCLWGLVVWRTRLYVTPPSLIIETRGFLGTKRRALPLAEVTLRLDANTRYGRFAKATVPTFSVHIQGGETLFRMQFVEADRLAEAIAAKAGQRLERV